jgi:hypothetical protein
MQKNRNRSRISLLLLLPVLIPLLVIVMNDVNKWRIKYQRSDRLNSAFSLVQVHIAADKVQWMDKKEIVVDGRMFDIKKSELKDGWYTFTGHYDDPETKWLRKQQKAQQQKDGQQTLLQVFKSLQQLYCESQESGFWPVTATLPQPRLQNDRLASAFPDVSTPPPQRSSIHTL